MIKKQKENLDTLEGNLLECRAKMKVFDQNLDRLFHDFMNDTEGNRIHTPISVDNDVFAYIHECMIVLNSTDGLFVTASIDEWLEKNPTFKNFKFANKEYQLAYFESRWYEKEIQKLKQSIAINEGHLQRLVSYKNELEYELQRPALMKERIEQLNKVIEMFASDYQGVNLNGWQNLLEDKI